MLTSVHKNKEQILRDFESTSCISHQMITKGLKTRCAGHCMRAKAAEVQNMVTVK